MSDDKIKILCVDDEPNVLEGLKRNLRREFDVRTEVGGAAGLQAVEETKGGFAVVVSDLRMPKMNGIEFLTKVRKLSPDATRVLLTGDANLTSVLAAVNEGNVFRFLTKPCSTAVLVPALIAAADQHRLVTAERELLEKTLHGSVNMLTEVLSIASPAAFGQVARVKRRVGAVAARLGDLEPWKVELAAMVFQVAHISLPNEVLESLSTGVELGGEEQKMVDRLPDVAVQLISLIPRLEDVQRILRHEPDRFDVPTAGPDGVAIEVPTGSRILKAVLDLNVLGSQAASDHAALEILRTRTGWYEPRVLDALSQVLSDGSDSAGEVREVYLRQLAVGMVLLHRIDDSAGRLLVPAGQEVSISLRERLQNFANNAGIHEPIRVLVPPE